MKRVKQQTNWRRGSMMLIAAVAATALTQAGAQRMHVSYVAHGGAANAPGARPTQGYLGVDVHDVTKDQLPALKLDSARGAEIIHVDHDGPAGKAGLREHDVILTLNGQAIEGEEHCRRVLRETPPGRPVTLVISRDGHEQTVSAQMANREDVERTAWEQHMTVPEPQSASQSAPAPAPEEKHGSGFFSAPGRASRSFLGSIVSPTYTGAMLETMAPQLAEYFGTQGKVGLLVRSVDNNSPAAQAGMHAGDVVVRVNATPIATSGDWLRAVRENKGKTISVVVLRDRREQTLQMVPNSKHHTSLLPDFWPFGSSTAKPVPDQACVLPIPFSM